VYQRFLGCVGLGADVCSVYSRPQVVDLVQTLDGGRRNMYDPDEIEEEQREREKRNKINADFKQFTTRVQVGQQGTQ